VQLTTARLFSLNPGYEQIVEEKQRVARSQTSFRLMGHARPRPKRLAEKLLKIRQALGVSQSAMVRRLGVKLAPNNISKYEHNLNEPPTNVMLAYARLARVPLEQLVDDELDLDCCTRSRDCLQA
jgi:DNA-binding transcriptional regulator YiaG